MKTEFASTITVEPGLFTTFANGDTFEECMTEIIRIKKNLRENFRNFVINHTYPKERTKFSYEGWLEEHRRKVAPLAYTPQYLEEMFRNITLLNIECPASFRWMSQIFKVMEDINYFGWNILDPRWHVTLNPACEIEEYFYDIIKDPLRKDGLEISCGVMPLEMWADLVNLYHQGVEPFKKNIVQIFDKYLK